jgi:hypothetical protein
MYDRQFFLDICDAMPDEKKKCGVSTLEDGTGTVDLGDFIVHYGEALVAHLQSMKPKRTKKKPNEDSCGK